MSKFQVILLVLVAAILVVAIIVASVVVVDYGQRREQGQWLQEKLQQTSTELKEKMVRAKANAASTEVGMLKAALERYAVDCKKYPTTEQGLAALVEKPAGLAEGSGWDGPYLRGGIPKDPWGNPIQYRVSGDKIELWSFGPDGRDCTPDDIRSEDAIRSK